MDRVAIDPKELLTDTDAFATTLLVVAADGLGVDNVVGRDPEGLVMDVEEHYGVDLPNVLRDRLIAAATLVDTDLFYVDPSSHNVLAQILAGEDLKAAAADLATFPQLAWALTEAWIIAPDPDGFSGEVVDFVLARAVADGFLVLPRSVRRRLKDYDDRDRELPNPIDAIEEINPDLYMMALSLHRERADELDRMVYGNVVELFEQLESLDLKRRDPRFRDRLRELMELLRRESDSE